MFKKRDALVIAAVLIVSAILYAITSSPSGSAISGTVEVYANNALYESAALGGRHEIRIEQEDGSVNVVAINGMSVRMRHSNCENQQCIQQGEVNTENWTRRALGRSIICLPNRVLIELVPDENGTAIDAPDI